MSLNQADLELYFQKLFPWMKFYNWLGYGDRGYFQRREFSFTLAGDIYLRFRSFADGKELQDDLVRKKPEKIDIGGVYNVPPKLKDSNSVFHAVEKEVVFDIDISDYDDVRVCCQDKSICNNCWPLMACAAHVLDRLLREDFGYTHLMFVFSGRRGLHCWTCDREARRLNDEERTALINYINVYEGGEGQRLNIEHQLRRNTLHPSLEAVYQDIIKPGFRDMFLSEEKNPGNSLRQPKTVTNVLNMVARHMKGFGQEQADRLNKVLVQGDKSCEDRWRGVQKFCTDAKAPWITRYIEFCFMYPRLDVNVSKHCNHLLKAPFVVHPGTGNVCLPVDIDTIHLFEPTNTPKLEAVLAGYEKGEYLLDSAFEEFQRFIDRCLVNSSAGQMEVDGNEARTS